MLFAALTKFNSWIIAHRLSHSMNVQGRWGGITCVEFGCIHCPHDRVDLPSRSCADKKKSGNWWFRRYEISKDSQQNVLLDISPFKRDVCGFLVTTLAVALFTCGKISGESDQDVSVCGRTWVDHFKRDYILDEASSRADTGCNEYFFLKLKAVFSQKFSLTSIFLPSTIVPFSFSLARSASVALSKVTNPKPCRFTRPYLCLFTLCFSFDTIFRSDIISVTLTLDPLSLKMISTSRILPNCWNQSKMTWLKCSTWTKNFCNYTITK